MSPSTFPHLKKRIFYVHIFILTLLFLSLLAVSPSFAQASASSTDAVEETLALTGPEMQTTPQSVTEGSDNRSTPSAPLSSADQRQNEDDSDLGTNQFPQQVHGIGSIFNSLLDTLLTFTTSSEYRFISNAKSFPQIFPDLKKVFITL